MQVSSQFGGLSNGIKCLLRTEVTRRKDRFGGMGQTTAVRWIALVFRLFSVTGDPEFKALEKEIKVQWLG